MNSIKETSKSQMWFTFYNGRSVEKFKLYQIPVIESGEGDSHQKPSAKSSRK